MKALLPVLAGCLITAGAAVPLGAADVTFSGSLDARAGYGTNPYLFQDGRGGSGLVGGTLTGEVDRTTGTSTSSLIGSADVTQNFSHYGTLDNYLVTAAHTQNLTEHLVLSGDASYRDSINPRGSYDYSSISTLTVYNPIGGAQVADLLTIGQRTHTLSGDLGLAWQATARDQFNVGVNGSRSRYAHSGLNGYDQYGANFGYLRTLDARTKVGATVSYTNVSTRGLPDSGSVYVGARLIRDFSAIWKFDGSLGVITGTDNRSRGGGTTLGATLSLCGTYPRYSICFTGARQSAASGLGGLTTHTTFTVDGTYQLTARSRVNLNASYDQSEPQRVIGLPRQRYYSAGARYSRDITQRIAVGASAQYQRREFGQLPAITNLRSDHANSYSVTGDVIIKFGRLK